MKTTFARLAALIALCACSMLPAQVSAHSINQPPFVYINDIAAGYYPVTYTSLPDFGLPQDTVNETVVPNQELRFKIDLTALPILPDELPFITFSWKLGDGVTHAGDSFTHAYAKPGPFLVELSSSDTRTKDAPVLLDTVLVNVLPTSDYVLPKATVRINGNTSTNFGSDILKADFNRKVSLEAAATQGTSPIASYRWDLGDQQVTTGASVMHEYNPILSTIVPVVRVTDSLGFYADATVQVENSKFAQGGLDTSTAVPDAKGAPKTAWIASGLGILLGAVGLGAYLRSRSRRKVSVDVRVKRQ